jgi:hypothetical protein
MAIAFGVYVHFFREEETSKESLPLHEHVILVRVLVVIGILDL